MRYFVAGTALFLLVALTACEPTVGIDFKGFPECPTSPAEYFARPTVPLGCPLPADSLLPPTGG